MSDAASAKHSHVFLGEDHARSERRTWAVIILCGVMMIAEIVGGLLFGSIALVADGLHMSTHAGAMLLAAMAYSFARRYASDSRFTFGTGKLGDLAGFTSAVVLAMIAVLIGYEAVSRLFAPVTIHFREALPIAGVGLFVNLASVWLLGGHDQGHGHTHGHAHGRTHGHVHGRGHHDGHEHAGDPAHDEAYVFETARGDRLAFSVFETGHPPVFRIAAQVGTLPDAAFCEATTLRNDGSRQRFAFIREGTNLQSVETIPEPHEFAVDVRLGADERRFQFAERGETAHGAIHRDNNMRAAIVHVIADAAVSALVIVGLALAWMFNWNWMDPLAGIVGACVIASWSYSLMRDTGAILLDMNPDRELTDSLRKAVESEGDQLIDLHVWRLGPGHLGAILSVISRSGHTPSHYRERLARFRTLSHVTVEIVGAA